MDMITVCLLVFGIGVIAGLRSMTAPAAVSWAAHLKWITLTGSSIGVHGDSTCNDHIFSARGGRARQR